MRPAEVSGTHLPWDQLARLLNPHWLNQPSVRSGVFKGSTISCNCETLENREGYFNLDYTLRMDTVVWPQMERNKWYGNSMHLRQLCQIISQWEQTVWVRATFKGASLYISLLSVCLSVCMWLILLWFNCISSSHCGVLKPFGSGMCCQVCGERAVVWKFLRNVGSVVHSTRCKTSKHGDIQHRIMQKHKCSYS